VEAMSELQGSKFSIDEIKNNKESLIDRVKKEKQEMLDEITAKESKISNLNVQISVMQTDLIALRAEQKTWVGRIENVNKAKEEMKNKLYE
jgi:hypothetical protein